MIVPFFGVFAVIALVGSFLRVPGVSDPSDGVLKRLGNSFKTVVAAMTIHDLAEDISQYVSPWHEDEVYPVHLAVFGESGGIELATSKELQLVEDRSLARITSECPVPLATVWELPLWTSLDPPETVWTPSPTFVTEPPKPVQMPTVLTWLVRNMTYLFWLFTSTVHLLIMVSTMWLMLLTVWMVLGPDVPALRQAYAEVIDWFLGVLEGQPQTARLVVGSSPSVYDQVELLVGPKELGETVGNPQASDSRTKYDPFEGPLNPYVRIQGLMDDLSTSISLLEQAHVIQALNLSAYHKELDRLHEEGHHLLCIDGREHQQEEGVADVAAAGPSALQSPASQSIPPEQPAAEGDPSVEMGGASDSEGSANLAGPRKKRKRPSLKARRRKHAQAARARREELERGPAKSTEGT
ncbi:hypothetical protein NUU61_005093 [Penicillium alfredii]|uniref:Uncharacterized protein n=1 Tax=Penicillium alfredii TaxID=1506179 RepID=A0A9W9F963_9EURO|nr:uncharacterized protein NUU61_005093 [Penicillium alfredii]KAJ5095737.1 hypothetical protein NUU61_005093 [Penicillium alfredii]